MLILSLTFRNIIESKHIRLLVYSIQKSVQDLLKFMILVIFVCFSFVIFLINSFGYSIKDVQNISYASMTMFKVFVGRGLGEFHRRAN